MGGVVVHPYGVTLSQPLGETLALVKAPGAKRVKVQNNPGVYTNDAGYAIVPYVSPYHRNRISLNTASLTENVDIYKDTQTVVPSFGALTLADYKTVTGAKVFVTLQGRTIPFGAAASVKQGDVTVQGIVDARQRVYLSGLPEKGTIEVSWKGGACQAPYHLQTEKAAVLSVTAVCG
ncbi:MAG: putative outer membrane usher protein LpfC' [Candidatus Erwinia impunctatus]|nr:putative outer membrane usher protein LpfC' [Culicoides impunctatus]